MKEPDHEKCKGVLHKAESGEIRIITSTLTIAEVIYLKPYPKMSKEMSDKICRMFEQEYIVPIALDRFIAESARNLLWQYSALKPKDAIHIASALKAKVPTFDTFDDGLITLTGTMGDPPLIIGKPNIVYQEKLFEEESEENT
jgi:hypothetical protein